MITQIASNVNGIFYIETIKRNRILTDRTCKGVLQQTNLVFININVGKHILQDGIQDVARLQEMIDTRRVLSLDNIFLALRTFAIDMLGNRFINGDGKNQPVIIWTKFHLIHQPFSFPYETAIQ